MNITAFMKVGFITGADSAVGKLTVMVIICLDLCFFEKKVGVDSL